MNIWTQRIQSFLFSQLVGGFIIGVTITFAVSFIDPTVFKNIISSNLFKGFVLGIIGSYFTSFTKEIAAKNKTISRVEAAIIRFIYHRRLRKRYDLDNPHWAIRSAWADCLRDLDSNKPKATLTALVELENMSDLLAYDEKGIAYEALRLKIGAKKNRDYADKFVQVMAKLE